MKKLIYIGMFMFGCLSNANAMFYENAIYMDENGDVVDMPVQVNLRPFYENYLLDRHDHSSGIRINGDDFVTDGGAEGLALFNAISDEDRDIDHILALLEHGVTFRTANGMNPLMLAARYGLTDLVERLVEIYDINEVNGVGDTPIMIAERYGHTETALRFLGNRRADISVVNDCGDTLFLLAARNGDDEMLQALVERVDVNQRSYDGYNALQYAFLNRRFETFVNLINIGVDPDIIDWRGETIGDLIRGLHEDFPDESEELWNLYRQVLEQHIQDLEEDPDSATRVLFWTVREGANAYALPLIGAVDLDTTDERGETVAMIAARTGNIEIMQHLIDAGINLEQRNPGGQTLILIALYHGQFEMADMLQQCGADTNATDNDGLSVDDYLQIVQG